MLNSVNLNEELNNTLQEQTTSISSVVTNPISNPYKNIDTNLLIDETAISDEAVSLYQKDQDISKFNQLAMSNPEDLSHEEIIDNLFCSGVSDPLSDEAIEGLSTNKNLLSDLGL